MMPSSLAYVLVVTSVFLVNVLLEGCASVFRIATEYVEVYVPSSIGVYPVNVTALFAPTAISNDALDAV